MKRMMSSLGIAAWVMAGTVVLTADPAEPTASGIARRFLEGRDSAPVSYRAVRRLTAGNEQRHISGWLTVLTELDPEGGFRYSIVSEGGSEYVRNKVLRKMLVREQQALQSDERRRGALSPENYMFGEATVDNQGFVLVPIAPRRHADLLIRGRIALSADGDLVRIEGRLEKNPSFWTRRVDIIRRYGRLNGVRVPLQLSSIARVLVVGLSTLSMCIDYEAINGEPVSPRINCS